MNYITMFSLRLKVWPFILYDLKAPFMILTIQCIHIEPCPVNGLCLRGFQPLRPGCSSRGHCI